MALECMGSGMKECLRYLRWKGGCHEELYSEGTSGE